MLSNLLVLVYTVVLFFFGNGMFTLCVTPLSSEHSEDVEFCHVHHFPHLREVLKHGRHKEPLKRVVY